MYKIYFDGICIYNDRVPAERRTLLNPKLTLEDSSAGSLEFTMTPGNAAYDKIRRMATKIVVTRNGKEIWEGRPLTESIDFYNCKSFICEGELAYLNDSVQPQAEYKNISPREYLDRLLARHNEQVEEDKRFYLGAVTVDDLNPTIYRYTDFESTMECINEKLLNTLGGHIRLRKVNGKRYLDYLEEYPTASTQVIKFGQNLLDFTNDMDSSSYCTAVLPIGARIEQEGGYSTEPPEDDDGTYQQLEDYTTIESVNDGSLFLESPEAVKTYGWICQKVEFDDIHTPEYLKKAAEKYLSDTQFDNMVLTVQAVDLNLLGVEWEDIDLLDMVQVKSKPHGLNRLFPVARLDIPLDSPQNTTFTLGDEVRASLSQSYHQSNTALADMIQKLPKKKSILDEARANAAQLINMKTTGFFTVKSDEYGSNEVYFAESQDLDVAQKMWKWTMGGLGYSKDGGQTYEAAITMDGTIMGNMIAAGTIGADQISVEYNTERDKILQNGLKNTEDSIKMWASEELDDYYSKSEIDVKTNAIDIAVKAKVGSDEIINAINLSKEGIKIDASKLNINAKSIRLQSTTLAWECSNSSMTEDGELTAWKINIIQGAEIYSNNVNTEPYIDFHRGMSSSDYDARISLESGQFRFKKSGGSSTAPVVCGDITCGTIHCTQVISSANSASVASASKMMAVSNEESSTYTGQIETTSGQIMTFQNGILTEVNDAE